MDLDMDSTEQCVSFSNNKWNKVSCRQPLPFVCSEGI